MFEVGNSCIASVEEYPSGSRGRFAKPLVAAMPARVQISPPPFTPEANAAGVRREDGNAGGERPGRNLSRG